MSDELDQCWTYERRRYVCTYVLEHTCAISQSCPQHGFMFHAGCTKEKMDRMQSYLIHGMANLWGEIQELERCKYEMARRRGEVPEDQMLVNIAREAISELATGPNGSGPASSVDTTAEPVVEGADAAPSSQPSRASEDGVTAAAMAGFSTTPEYEDDPDQVGNPQRCKVRVRKQASSKSHPNPEQKKKIIKAAAADAANAAVPLPKDDAPKVSQSKAGLPRGPRPPPVDPAEESAHARARSATKQNERPPIVRPADRVSWNQERNHLAQQSSTTEDNAGDVDKRTNKSRGKKSPSPLPKLPAKRRRDNDDSRSPHRRRKNGQSQSSGAANTSKQGQGQGKGTKIAKAAGAESRSDSHNTKGDVSSTENKCMRYATQSKCDDDVHEPIAWLGRKTSTA